MISRNPLIVLVELSGIERAGHPALTGTPDRGQRFAERHKRKSPDLLRDPGFYLVELSGIEPLTSTLPVLRSPS